MIVKPLTEHHLAVLSLTGGCRGSSESTLVKMSCLKSHAAAQLVFMNKFLDNLRIGTLGKNDKSKHQFGASSLV